MKRILVTGSRDLTDVDLVHDALSEAFEQADDDVTIVHGGARGADRMAGEWVKLMRRYGVREEVHNADWHRYGRGAGPKRNEEMVAAGADVVLAFRKLTSENIGTNDCVRRAKLAGLTVIEYAQP